MEPYHALAFAGALLVVCVVIVFVLTVESALERSNKKVPLLAVVLLMIVAAFAATGGLREIFAKYAVPAYEASGTEDQGNGEN